MPDQAMDLDSDISSDEDDQTTASYTETAVLLGYASAEPCDETVGSHLGGYPTWLAPLTDPSCSTTTTTATSTNTGATASTTSTSTTTPSAALARCAVCKDLMVLLLQLTADLPERFPGHERRLYVFACRRRSCRRKEGCVGAVRGVRVTDAGADADGADDDVADGAGADGAGGANGAAEATKKNDESAGEGKKEDTRTEEQMQPQGLGEAIFGVSSTSAKNGSKASNGPFNPFAMAPSHSQPANPFLITSPSAINSSVPYTTTKPNTTQAKNGEGITDDTFDLPQSFASTVRITDDTTKTSSPFSSIPSSSSPRPSSRQKSSIPHEPWPPESQQPRPYTHSYLEADYETLDRPSTQSHHAAPPSSSSATVEQMHLDPSTTSDSTSSLEDKLTFESSLDKAFQRFADRLAQNPEQVLRYEFGGEPLLYSTADGVGARLKGAVGQQVSDPPNGVKVQVGGRGRSGMPACGNCGAERLFEVQLMPHAITKLEEGEEGSGLEGMEWGTVIVGVCSADCRPKGVGGLEVGYLREWVGVQWEEVVGK